MPARVVCVAQLLVYTHFEVLFRLEAVGQDNPSTVESTDKKYAGKPVQGSNFLLARG